MPAAEVDSGDQANECHICRAICQQRRRDSKRRLSNRSGTDTQAICLSPCGLARCEINLRRKIEQQQGREAN